MIDDDELLNQLTRISQAGLFGPDADLFSASLRAITRLREANDALLRFIETHTQRRCENDHCWGGVDDLSCEHFVGGENICEFHKARRLALLKVAELGASGRAP